MLKLHEIADYDLIFWIQIDLWLYTPGDVHHAQAGQVSPHGGHIHQLCEKGHSLMTLEPV